VFLFDLAGDRNYFRVAPNDRRFRAPEPSDEATTQAVTRGKIDSVTAIRSRSQNLEKMNWSKIVIFRNALESVQVLTMDHGLAWKNV